MPTTTLLILAGLAAPVAGASILVCGASALALLLGDCTACLVMVAQRYAGTHAFDAVIVQVVLPMSIIGPTVSLLRGPG